MFSEDFRESQQNEVELHGITAAGLKALLEFAYTGKNDGIRNFTSCTCRLKFM